MRRRKRRGNKRKILIIFSICFLFLMSAGYAAFQTNLSIGGQTNLNMDGIFPSELKTLAVTEGDGLYVDEYENGRYIYKGATPDNYIMFNDEVWRIISVENNNTLKIIKNENIGALKFDSTGLRDKHSEGTGGTYCASGLYGCHAWAVNDNFVSGSRSGTVLLDSELNIYLNNQYYSSLNEEYKDKIAVGDFNVGSVKFKNSNLAEHINSEKEITWNGKIGLITSSEYLRSNTNVEECGTYLLVRNNKNVCKSTNYLVSLIPESSPKSLWTITPNAYDGYFNTLYVDNEAYLSARLSNAIAYVFPVIYLRANILLKGDGTSSSPYVIE